MKRPKLHLRDLFWLIALVAMGLGWWLHTANLRSDTEKLWRAVDEAGFGLMPTSYGYRLVGCLGSGRPQQLD